MQQKEFRAKSAGKKADKNVKELVQQAREHTKAQRFDEALSTYMEILKENPEAAAAYMGVGGVHLRKGELDEAENYFNGALHVTKKVAPVLAMLADVAQKRGDMTKALKLNQEALEDDPKFIKAAMGVGKILFQLERYDEARQAVAGALKYSPNSNEAEILLARIMQKMGQSEDAIENLNKLLVRDPQSWSAYFFQAQMYLREKQFEAAIEAANSSLRLKPDNIRALTCLGQALIGAKKYIKAIDILGDVLAVNPEMWNAKMLLAKAHFLNGDLEEARTLLSKIVIGRRGLGSVYFMLGDISAAQGLFTHALAEYGAAVLHADKLVEKFPQLRELIDKQMAESDKVAEFKRLLTEIRARTDAEDQQDVLV